MIDDQLKNMDSEVERYLNIIKQRSGLKLPDFINQQDVFKIDPKKNLIKRKQLQEIINYGKYALFCAALGGLVYATMYNHVMTKKHYKPLPQEYVEITDPPYGEMRVYVRDK